MRKSWGLAFLLVLAGCATPPPSPEAFTFGVMGDMPYDENEEKLFLSMMKRLDGETLEFIVHVGDFKSGSTPCTDAIFRERFEQLNASANPIVLTPGDNEWTDCRRKPAGSMDPLERLRRLRQIFFVDEWSLGRRRIRTEIQSECLEGTPANCTCGPYPENRAWTHRGVRFVTLNVPGSDNNIGFDAASDAEARCRGEANRRWLERAVTESQAAGERALVVAVQANPWMTRKPGVFDPFLATLVAASERLRKPLLFVHGDSHTYRYDTPFVDALGNPLPYITRLETYGSPQVGWVRVIVDPADPDFFGIEGKLQGIAAPGSALR